MLIPEEGWQLMDLKNQKETAVEGIFDKPDLCWFRKLLKEESSEASRPSAMVTLKLRVPGVAGPAEVKWPCFHRNENHDQGTLVWWWLECIPRGKILKSYPSPTGSIFTAPIPQILSVFDFADRWKSSSIYVSYTADGMIPSLTFLTPTPACLEISNIFFSENKGWQGIREGKVACMGSVLEVKGKVGLRQLLPVQVK